MSQTLLDVHRRPTVVFNPANPDHRKYLAEFYRKGTWGTCPVLFYAQGDVSIRSSTIEQLIEYYLNAEFPVKAEPKAKPKKRTVAKPFTGQLFKVSKMKTQNIVLSAVAVAALGAVGYIADKLETIVNRLDTMQEQIDRIGNLVDTRVAVRVNKADLECLTRNIYYEAGTEGEAGRYAVAHVTINRLVSGYWGNNLCKVVYSKSQFSWTKLKKLPKPNKQLWNDCEAVARKTLSGMRVSGLERSLFYYADYIKQPKWVDDNHYITQIGRHKFYNQAKNSWVSI